MDGAVIQREGDTPREASLRDFAAVCFRRKWVVFAAFLAGLGVVALLNATRPVLYESVARVLVSRGQPESAYTSRMKPLLSWEEELNSEMETVTSGHIIELAQKLLDAGHATGGDGKPVELEPGRVTAAINGKSSVIYIKYQDLDPIASRDGCRAITQAYSEFRQQVRAVPEVDKFFREEIEDLRLQLEDWEQRRADFMAEESVVRISEERSSLIEVRRSTELKLNDVRADLASEEAKVEVMRSRIRGSAKGDYEVYPFSEADNSDDQTVAEVKRQLIQERTAYFTAAGQYTEQHPEVLGHKTRMEELQKELKREVDSYLKHLESKVEVLKAREEALLGTLHYVDSELSGFPSKEARLTSFDRVLKSLQADYDALVEKQIQARIERTGTSDYNVLVLQAAQKAVALRTNDIVRMALIPLLSLFVGFALAFLLDGLDHSLKDATEVETHLRLPVLGSVGKLR
ncbi:MAG: hypothetical protein IT349_13615 [Candidatus Eisenbacteria bacterium]|nr:hypothetical protein [Candidatus Eisenbacteria bacterium]MCC7143132.1 hypothetical protein [Candidatus Eisenbacteria bacterium]